MRHFEDVNFPGQPGRPLPTRYHLMTKEQRQTAEGNELFMELLRGPNALTPEEIDKFCDRRPQWERFRGFGAKAIKAREEKESK